MKLTEFQIVNTVTNLVSAKAFILQHAMLALMLTYAAKPVMTFKQIFQVTIFL